MFESDCSELNTHLLENGILHIELNRPQQRNALNSNLLLHFKKILWEAKSNAAVRAILLTGAGKLFCAGADISELTHLNGSNGQQFAKDGQETFLLLEHLGKPSIAAIQGAAFGGGLELAMACTLRVSETNAVFAQPEIKLGIIPGFAGTQRLPHLIGKGRALQLCLTGESISATTAHQWGLINEVVSINDLQARALTLLTSVIQYGSIAIQSIMHCIQQGMHLAPHDGQHLEALYFSQCARTKDKQEGVSAFLEKRTAVFSGE